MLILEYTASTLTIPPPKKKRKLRATLGAIVAAIVVISTLLANGSTIFGVHINLIPNHSATTTTNLPNAINITMVNYHNSNLWRGYVGTNASVKIFVPSPGGQIPNPQQIQFGDGLNDSNSYAETGTCSQTPSISDNCYVGGEVTIIVKGWAGSWIQVPSLLPPIVTAYRVSG